MIISRMKATSAGDFGGTAALVEGGRVLLGCPGAPGCTTTGPTASLPCGLTPPRPSSVANIAVHAAAQSQIRLRQLQGLWQTASRLAGCSCTGNSIWCGGKLAIESRIFKTFSPTRVVAVRLAGPLILSAG